MTLIEQMTHWRFTLPNRNAWRPLDTPLGAIIGLPQVSGKLVATDGILAILVPESTLFGTTTSVEIVHLDWFHAHKSRPSQVARAERRTAYLTERYGI